jgi:hypothetical protein
LVVSDPRPIEFAKRVQEQCERFDVSNNIDLKADLEQLKLQVCLAMTELGLITGIPPSSADFIGLIECFSANRFSCFR